jgi:Sec-independent protein translocase protein TatA
MDPGLILLVFLALLVAFGWSRLRRRAGMGTTGGRTWLIVMAVFILVVLTMWAYTTHR